jgi:hypothetical protein
MLHRIIALSPFQESTFHLAKYCTQKKNLTATEIQPSANFTEFACATLFIPAQCYAVVAMTV